MAANKALTKIRQNHAQHASYTTDCNCIFKFKKKHTCTCTIMLIFDGHFPQSCSPKHNLSGSFICANPAQLLVSIHYNLICGQVLQLFKTVVCDVCCMVHNLALSSSDWGSQALHTHCPRCAARNPLPMMTVNNLLGLKPGLVILVGGFQCSIRIV